MLPRNRAHRASFGVATVATLYSHSIRWSTVADHPLFRTAWRRGAPVIGPLAIQRRPAEWDCIERRCRRCCLGQFFAQGSCLKRGNEGADRLQIVFYCRVLVSCHGHGVAEEMPQSPRQSGQLPTFTHSRLSMASSSRLGLGWANIWMHARR